MHNTDKSPFSPDANRASFGAAQQSVELPVDIDAVTPGEAAIEQDLQQKWTSFETTLRAAAGSREPLGELLLLAKRIDREQLERALSEQARTRERLGDVLIRFGCISNAERDAALAFQHNQDGVDGPLRLGNLLVTIGIITQEQLTDALQRQRATRKRLGTILVEAGYAAPDQVQRGLSLQRRLVRNALTSLLALCALGAVAALPLQANAASMLGPDKNGKTRASASLDFALKIPAYLRVKFLKQPQMLTIGADDVAKGYVDVPADTHLQVETNNRDGFLVTFRGRFDIVRKVLVNGMTRVVEIDAVDAGATVRHLSRAAETTLALGYRFVLAPDTKPGSYPWPMAISAGTQY